MAIAPQQYLDIFRSIPLGLVVLQLEDINDVSTFRLVAVNPAAREMLELPTEMSLEAIATSPFTTAPDPFPAFLKIEALEVYAEVLRTATRQDLDEIRYRNSRMLTQVFALKAFPLPHQCVGVMLEDITNRRQIQDALQEKQELFQRIVSTAQEGIWVLDVEGKTSYTNQRMGDMLGYSAQEMLGCSFLEFMDSDARALAKANFARQRGISEQHDFRFRRRDGSDLWTIIATNPLFDETQQFMGVLGIITNITERKWAEVKLDASETRYQQLFESSKDGILIVDGETGQITDANPFLIKLLGYSYSELLEKKLWELSLLEDIEASRVAYQTLQDVGYMRCENLPLRTKDGRQVEVEIVSSVYSVGDKDVIQCNIRDITERKRIEAELRQFTARLEQSNRELQDFASVASHDLQEPLRKIQALGDRLKVKCNEALTDEGRDYLDRMQSAAKRMQTLINDLLTFSRVTTKAQPFVKVDLTEIVQEVLSDLEIYVQQVNGCVEVANLPTLDADPLQMRQLLQNLISNALKFHGKEAPIVKIKAEFPLSSTANLSSPSISEEESPNLRYQSCQITVTDNGIGFDEKYLDRIFTVFQRLHGRNEYEGTGIGLAICRKIVERHGGTITAKSSPGQGATFIMTLPVQQPCLI